MPRICIHKAHNPLILRARNEDHDLLEYPDNNATRRIKAYRSPVLPNLQSVQYGTQSKVNQLEEFLGPGRKSGREGTK